MTPATTFTAFVQGKRIASGTQAEVASVLRQLPNSASALFVFNDQTGAPVDLDLREDAPNSGQCTTAMTPTEDNALTEQTQCKPVRGVGRPKLGVVAREVTLLPRHWDWLNRQPGGASVALRKLVEDARRVNASRDAVRAAREVAYRFMSAIAGHESGFEEASRALFAGHHSKFDDLIAPWPQDVRQHLTQLAAPAWQADPMDGEAP